MFCPATGPLHMLSWAPNALFPLSILLTLLIFQLAAQLQFQVGLRGDLTNACLSRLTAGEVVSASAHSSTRGIKLGLIKHLVDECMCTASRQGILVQNATGGLSKGLRGW